MKKEVKMGIESYEKEEVLGNIWGKKGDIHTNSTHSSAVRVEEIV